MPVLCIAQSHKPRGNVICCGNWEQIRHWPRVTALFFLALSPLYSEGGATKGSCGVTVVQGMMHSSGCALPRVPGLLLAFPGVTPTTGTPLAFRCASLCPCTDRPWGGNVNPQENSFLHLLAAPPSVCFFPCSLSIVKESVLTFKFPYRSWILLFLLGIVHHQDFLTPRG